MSSVEQRTGVKHISSSEIHSKYYDAKRQEYRIDISEISKKAFHTNVGEGGYTSSASLQTPSAASLPKSIKTELSSFSKSPAEDSKQAVDLQNVQGWSQRANTAEELARKVRAIKERISAEVFACSINNAAAMLGTYLQNLKEINKAHEEHTKIVSTIYAENVSSGENLFAKDVYVCAEGLGLTRLVALEIAPALGRAFQIKDESKRKVAVAAEESNLRFWSALTTNKELSLLRLRCACSTDQERGVCHEIERLAHSGAEIFFNQATVKAIVEKLRKYNAKQAIDL